MFNSNYGTPLPLAGEQAQGFGYLKLRGVSYKGNYRVGKGNRVSFSGVRSGTDKSKGHDPKISVDVLTTLEAVGQINHSVRYTPTR